jgi:iron-sulfur cluster assembly protein
MPEVVVGHSPEVAEEVFITSKAADQIRKIKSENKIPEANALRLGVKGGGCSGLSYVLGFEEHPRTGDKDFHIQGLKVFVDPKSLFYLNGTTLDFSDGLNGKGFVFNNPNAHRTCGCGNSFGLS